MAYMDYMDLAVPRKAVEFNTHSLIFCIIFPVSWSSECKTCNYKNLIV